jgi:hypothetical protein
MKSKRRNWMAKDKMAILQCIDEGLKAKAIKRKLFPGDRSLRYNALAKVIERLKKNRNWATQEPSIVFNFNRQNPSTKNKQRNSFFWPIADKKRIYALMQKGYTAGEIKEKLFPSDDSVTVSSIYTLCYRLKQDPSWVTHAPTSHRVTAFVSQNENGTFDLDSIHGEFSEYKKKVLEFNTAINSLIDDGSPFNQNQQKRIRDLITAESLTAIKEKQSELLQKIN